MATLTPTFTPKADTDVSVYEIEGTNVDTDDVICLVADDIYVTYQLLSFRATVSGGTAAEINPEFHDSATPTAASKLGSVEWRAGETPGLSLDSWDGPAYLTVAGRGLFLRLKPDDAATAYRAVFSLARVKGPV